MKKIIIIGGGAAGIPPRTDAVLREPPGSDHSADICGRHRDAHPSGARRAVLCPVRAVQHVCAGRGIRTGAALGAPHARYGDDVDAGALHAGQRAGAAGDVRRGHRGGEAWAAGRL